MGAGSVVAFFVNGIGDYVMTLPALRALVRMYGSRLTLVGTTFAEDCFFPPLGAGRVLTVTTHDGPEGREFDARELADRIGDCDLLVSLNPWHTDSVDAFLAHLRPRRSIGFYPGHTDVLPLDFGIHATDMAFSVARFLDPGAELDECAGPLALPVTASRRAAALRSMLPDGARVLAVHADTDPKKMWDAAIVREGVHRFLELRPDYWALVVGLRDLGLDQGSCEARVITCCGLRLPNSMALVGSADLFCGVDSSMLHVADLCRVPGIGLFRATSPAEFGFRFARHQHLDFPASGEAIAGALAALALGAPHTHAAVAS